MLMDPIWALTYIMQSDIYMYIRGQSDFITRVLVGLSRFLRCLYLFGVS